MEEEQPQPDDPARDHTAAQYKRPRSDSGSSTSVESLHSTRSLRSDDLEFIHENDRIYGNSVYYMPCDQAEQDRLAILHQVFTYALKGKLTTTNVSHATRRILDVGTGPGHWAVAMAEQYPHAEVVGVDMAVWDLDMTEEDVGSSRVIWEIDDLDVWGTEADMDALNSRLKRYDPFRDHTAPLHSPSRSKFRLSDPHAPLQPHSPTTEPSFNPYILDPEDQPGWHFSDSFDLIHARNMRGTFADWEDFYAEVYKHLSPGGWVEIADYELAMPQIPEVNDEPGEPSTNQPPLPTLRRIILAMMQASFKAGRPLGTYYMHPTYLQDAGFKDVRTTYVNVPVGQWPDDEEQKRIGKMFLVVLMESMEAQLLRLLTTTGDDERVWTPEEVRLEVEKAKLEIFEWAEGLDGKLKGVTWCASFKWVVGRKSKTA
ncbi:S-adenosyl-L-methionine-dependent methyltransferase [Massariosphaeria phaeospora]|uniref:S-adenosyl-L-methionine-dependent methyltransferase n=1 Tax=Massariosphaeria phaeospora TaxID=100035 RepID=A0A7C8HZQ8_9PLEO|nr:S-adenosyl-L-methionine-dependent methyltransferase [Massariosphaeria phaeospora]